MAPFSSEVAVFVTKGLRQNILKSFATPNDHRLFLGKGKGKRLLPDKIVLKQVKSKFILK